MRSVILYPMIGVLVLSSCGILGLKVKPAPKEEPSPFGPTGIPPELRAKGPGGSSNASNGTPVVSVGNTPQVGNGPMQFTPESEIVFTNPDNPEAGLPELSTIIATPKQREPWEISDTIAKRRAGREGKPLLIWFTDSKNSPMCKALSQELFSKPDFESWASEKLIRLRVDANYSSNEYVNDPKISIDEKNTRRSDSKNYIATLKKRYNILGYPTLLMLNPSGEVIGTYRGYKRGQADFTWGQIKHSEAVSASFYKEWCASLEKRGYREWQDRKERKVFAKLVSYSNGTLTLIEPEGTRSKTSETQLSDKDQKWIDQQKKLHGIQ